MHKFSRAPVAHATTLRVSKYGSKEHHPKPFTVVGYIDGQYTEDIGEEAALKRLIVKKVKEVSGSGVIRTSCSSGRGDSYFVGNVLITDTDIKDEYVVFRYQ